MKFVCSSLSLGLAVFFGYIFLWRESIKDIIDGTAEKMGTKKEDIVFGIVIGVCIGLLIFLGVVSLSIK